MNTMTKPIIQTPGSTEGLISSADAAESLHIEIGTFRHHVRSGKITPAETIKIGGWSMCFYRPEDVEALREALRPGGQPGKGRPRKSDAKK